MTARARLARLDALAGPAARSRRGRALRIAGLVLLVALAAFALREVDVREVLRVLARTDPALALAACAANVLSLAVHARRWSAVIQPRGRRPRGADSFAAIAAGFGAGVLLPARAGDLIRCAILSRRSGVPVATLVAAAALDYVIGAAALVPLLALLALATPLPAWAEHTLLGLAVLSALGGLGVWLLRPRRAGPGLPHAHGHPGAPRRGKVADLVHRLRDGFEAAHAPWAIAASVGWGLAGWAAEVVIAWCSLAAVGLPPTLGAASLAVVASTAANVVAVSPGNAGPFELAVVVALAGLGIDREPALAFALLYHLVHLAPVAVIGGAVLWREARRAGPAPGGDAAAGP